MPVPFHAAKDLVYTINGNNISSGGYRISKILNGKSKKKGKQEGGGGYRNIYNEDSGIPVGLLLIQRLHFDRDDDNEDKNKNANDYNVTKIDSGSKSNKKLVYASIIENNSDDGDNNGGENIELVIMPPVSSGHEGKCYSENSTEICSNEIDHELYDSLVKSVSEPGHRPNAMNVIEMAPILRKTSTTKKQHVGKHKDVEKVFQKRRTRSKRRRD
jgi:hypothetical protein